MNAGAEDVPSPSQPSHHAGFPGGISFNAQADGFLVSLAPGHQDPGHPRNLVGQRDGSDLGRAPRQQSRQPWPMPGAVDLGIADDGECTGRDRLRR
jgi:hypothetical protein